jgi:hypothetical protein
MPVNPVTFTTGREGYCSKARVFRGSRRIPETLARLPVGPLSTEVYIKVATPYHEEELAKNLRKKKKTQLSSQFKKISKEKT